MGIAAELTMDDVHKYVKEILAEVGEDHVYARFGRTAAKAPMVICYYSDQMPDGTIVPSCLVARILAKHGMTGEELSELDGHGSIFNVVTAHPSLVPRVSAETLAFLSRLQGEQDHAATWGAAYESACELMPA